MTFTSMIAHDAPNLSAPALSKRAPENFAITKWRAFHDPADGNESRLTWADLRALLSKPAPRPSDPRFANFGGWSAATFQDRRREKARTISVFALVYALHEEASSTRPVG